jgi:predicted MFS family arabinose efflux permease
MDTKKMIWIGVFVGSTIGGLVPSLWHASMFSMWGLVFSTIGGLAGIWAGWKMGQRL